ncbi:phage reverse transcriptase [Candidatus Termititenax aidoneus]|uniref:Phage reverse transcriptase n=1 Tax=Termititenax aidoneus TaxID=2218524 RepID=A0A388TCH9_TERA1|nr:phage reverse transcriptase [Candidatus Termititenax aidoneus]
MKRYGNIYAKICDLENLRIAHRKARRDKSYYIGVRMVNSDEDFYLQKIQNMLVSKSYYVGKYTVEEIIDKGKHRIIAKLPYFPDRIIQWAIMLQIESVFNSVFTNFACASIKNRGVHYASKILKRFLRDERGTRYCLKLDIKKFYDNVDREILKKLLRKKFKDNDLLELLDKIIDSSPGKKGIPIGSFLSQYFANFYLSYFDHWLKEVWRVRYVIRYMDDIVIFHSSKLFLHELKEHIAEYLAVELNLELKRNWQIFPVSVRGVDFVGYRHFPKFKLLRKNTCKRFKKIIMKAIKQKFISLHDYFSLNAYDGWLKWCDGWHLKTKYYQKIREAVL